MTRTKAELISLLEAALDAAKAGDDEILDRALIELSELTEDEVATRTETRLWNEAKEVPGKGVRTMPLQNKDPLVQFQNWIREMPRAELGGLLKEYLAESNHNGWDIWNRRDLTGIRHLFEDMMLYYKNSLEQLGSDEPPDFATKITTTNPVP